MGGRGRGERVRVRVERGGRGWVEGEGGERVG